MMLVQNRRLLLNGSKLLLFFLVFTYCFQACSPRVLRPRAERTPKEKEAEKTDEKETEEPLPEAEVSASSNIALLLPFQLDKISGPYPNKADIDRSSLALDFYQGFKMGLDKLVAEGDRFTLDVIDSKDNVIEVQRLANSEAIKNAGLIVGPVYPSEIEAFSNNAQLGEKLQVSPLAAGNPAQYRVKNLVTVTPPIEVHASAIANYLKEHAKLSDRIVIVNPSDNDSKKFIDPLKEALRKAKLKYDEIQDVADLETTIGIVSKNYVIAGSTNSFSLMPLIERLYTLKEEEEYDIDLFGHPNWYKVKLDPVYLEALNTKISSSYFMSDTNVDVARFKEAYAHQYQLEPSEFAFKGYDTGLFFGSLLSKYPQDYAKQLLNQTYRGIATGFQFQYDINAGYVNYAVDILQFSNNAYGLLRTME